MLESKVPVMPTVRFTVVIATRINAVIKMNRFSVDETLKCSVLSFEDLIHSNRGEFYLTTVRKFLTSSVSVRVVFCCGFALMRMRFPEKVCLNRESKKVQSILTHGQCLVFYSYAYLFD